jgi:hypothetical protein
MEEVHAPIVMVLQRINFDGWKKLIVCRDCFAEFILSVVEGLAMTKRNVIARSRATKQSLLFKIIEIDQ